VSALSDLSALLPALERMAGVSWCPHEPFDKQKRFLSLGTEEAFYGGAARGGKSDALLMAALDYIHVPGYSALILRRTFKELSMATAIMDRSHDWFTNTPAEWDGDNKCWSFPTGGEPSRISFGYLETEVDKHRYQGPAFQYIAFDEVTNFLESQYTYLFSRLSRLKTLNVPLRMRCAGNPGGVGHEWVKERFVSPGHPDRPFVPATIYDNPHEDHAAYEKAISHSDEITRRQMLYGEWIRDAYGLIYPYEPVRNGAHVLPDRKDWQYTLAWDFGTSQSKPTTAFAICAYSFSVPTMYVVRSAAYAALGIDGIARITKDLAAEFGSFAEVGGDQGGLGGEFIRQMQERFLIPMEPTRKADKLGHRRLMRGDMERGMLKVVVPGNADLIREMGSLSWDERGLDNEKGAADHLTDAALYAWRAAKHYLAQKPEDQPTRGTAEYVEWQEEQNLALIDAQREEAERRPWWDR